MGSSRERPEGATSSSNRGSTSANSSFTRKPSASQRPRPSVVFQEIDSEEERTKLPATQRGVLAGMNPNAVLRPQTQESIEISDDAEVDSHLDDNVKARKTKRQNSVHVTRASRHGRAAVDYDQKYHPMDEVVRPKRAAKRRSGSRSLSISIKREDESEGETSEESEPSEGHSDDPTEDGEDDKVPSATQRAPDPKATRHSGRSEAKKLVDYSRKHHPQDHGLPGYRNRAVRAEESDELPPAHQARKRKIVPTADANDTASRDLREGSSVRPRKQLKSLLSSSPSAVKARNKPLSKRNTGSTHAKDDGLALMPSEELSETINYAAVASEQPSLQHHSAVIGETDEDENAGDFATDSGQQSSSPTEYDATTLSKDILKLAESEAGSEGQRQQFDDEFVTAADSDADHLPTPARSGHRPTQQSSATQTMVEGSAVAASSNMLTVVKPYGVEGYNPTGLHLRPLRDPAEGLSPTRKTRVHVLRSSTAAHRQATGSETSRSPGTSRGRETSSTFEGFSAAASRAMSPSLVDSETAHKSDFDEQMVVTDFTARENTLGADWQGGAGPGNEMLTDEWMAVTDFTTTGNTIGTGLPRSAGTGEMCQDEKKAEDQELSSSSSHLVPRLSLQEPASTLAEVASSKTLSQILPSSADTVALATKAFQAASRAANVNQVAPEDSDAVGGAVASGDGEGSTILEHGPCSAFSEAATAMEDADTAGGAVPSGDGKPSTLLEHAAASAMQPPPVDSTNVDDAKSAAATAPQKSD